MGRSFTPKYAVEMDGSTSCGWQVTDRYGVKGNGKPTDANLAKYVNDYIDSMKPGGVNQHIPKMLGYTPNPRWARIVLNNGFREVVAEWKDNPRKKITGPMEF